MEPIDQPFRFTWDFCVIWALLTVPALIQVLSGRWNFGPWYSNVAFIIVVPFIATFFIYGPVLFVRQIIGSGSRGWFVARVFVTIVLMIALFFGILLVVGRGKDISSFWCLIVAGVAGAYLHWRIDGREQ
jgi:hypothetical protein